MSLVTPTSDGDGDVIMSPQPLTGEAEEAEDEQKEDNDAWSSSLLHQCVLCSGTVRSSSLSLDIIFVPYVFFLP